MASPCPSPTLARPDDVTVGAGPDPALAPPPAGQAPPPAPHPRLSVAILCLINLVNYMDRFTVAGVLPEVEDYFGIGDSSSGLLQTVFISSYLVLAPLFGFLGDRHSRKRLLALGLGLWSGVTLATSFVPPQHFGVLLAGRALVGVGEAAYSTLAPTLVADLYRGPARSRALGAFYLAVTPVLGVAALLLLLAVVRDPPRGGLDGAGAAAADRSWAREIRELGHNRTLVLSTLGFTAVAFVTGALALWAPAFLFRVRLAGRGGALPGGTALPRRPEVFIFLGETLLSLNWAIVADILLYVVPPGRRSTAEALQILTSHLLGDAGSPYLVGLLSDALGGGAAPLSFQRGAATVPYWSILLSDALGGGAAPLSFQRGAAALRRALLPLPFAAALGGAAFLAAAAALPRDRRRARRAARAPPPPRYLLAADGS
uniref:LOW QUALITY PROTEIN: protein spinster homolog 1-like n=1 Tax=Lonchura striata TaxID=40157 RepID=UPI00129398D6|nr:LOW QUALITY PROTEIN: protein spinster homolog 1-like [Lonchura striata domestica]